MKKFNPPLYSSYVWNCVMYTLKSTSRAMVNGSYGQILNVNEQLSILVSAFHQMASSQPFMCDSSLVP